MTKKTRPRDINQLAKFIVELSTGEITEKKQLSTVKPVKSKKQDKK
jgi:hypothetical protein